MNEEPIEPETHKPYDADSCDATLEKLQQLNDEVARLTAKQARREGINRDDLYRQIATAVDHQPLATVLRNIVSAFADEINSLHVTKTELPAVVTAISEATGVEASESAIVDEFGSLANAIREIASARDERRGVQNGILPLYIDDGTIIDCVSISGGADSTNGVPNQLTIAIKRPDGSGQHVRYFRSQMVADAVTTKRRGPR